MRVSVAVHGHLRQTSGVGSEEVSFTLPDAGGVRVRDVLETLNIWEEEIKEVVMNGKRARMDSTLRGRVHLEFFPRRR